MKKTKINLLTYRTDYQKIEKYFFALRFFILIFSIIFFISIFLFYSSVKKQNDEIDGLLNRKKTLLESISQDKNKEAKIVYVQSKYQSLKYFMNDDARFLPYYNLLSSALTKSTDSAELKSFRIDKQRSVDFQVSFSNLGDLTDFFKFIESDQFLANFEKLSLKNFTALNENSKANETNSYELSFTGKFNLINGNNN